jgi:hypothetical protein
MSTTVRTGKYRIRKTRKKTEKEEYSAKIKMMEEFAVSWYAKFYKLKNI